MANTDFNWSDWITGGTVGGKDWFYKDAAPIGFGDNTFGAYHGEVTCVPVSTSVVDSMFSKESEDVLTNTYNEYWSYIGSALRTVRAQYPLTSIKSYKLAAMPDEGGGETDYTLFAYDGSQNIVGNVVYSDLIPCNSDGSVIGGTEFVELFASIYNDDVNIPALRSDSVRLTLSANDNDNFFASTIPVFDKSNKTGMESYLRSADIDPTAYGGYLLNKRITSPSFTDKTAGDPTEVSGDLGFDLRNGIMRGAVISEENERVLATKIGKGWFADNVGQAIIGYKYVRTPGEVSCDASTEIIPPSTFDPTAVYGYPLINQFQKFSFGSVAFGENFRSFLDYTSTEVSLYLPFSGLHSLDNKVIIGSSMGIDCYIDYVSGSCIWYVTVDRDGVSQVLYTFDGNCSMDLPLTSIDYAQKITQALTGIIGITTSVGNAFLSTTVKANPSGELPGMGGAVSGAVSLAQASTNSYVSVGSVSSNFGWPGVMYPYVVFSRSVPSYPSSYNNTKGRPCMKTLKLGDISGYTVVSEIHLDNINALSEEKTELYELLTNGVIL